MRKSAAPLVQVKAGPDAGLLEGQFTGYASIFGNKDSYGDIVQKGAFAETLAAWDAAKGSIPVLWGHNMADPFANIGSVITAEEDERGLKVTAQLDLDNPTAAQVYRLIKGDRVDQMSFAYDVLEGAPAKDGEDEYYSLDKLKLYEVSIVPIGANPETEILAVKSTVDQLAQSLKAGRTFSAANEKAIDSIADQMISGGKELKAVLAASRGDDGDDQKKTSGHTNATAEASAQEPSPATAPAEAKEQRVNPSVDVWATQLSLLALGNE